MGVLLSSFVVCPVLLTAFLPLCMIAAALVVVGPQLCVVVWGREAGRLTGSEAGNLLACFVLQLFSHQGGVHQAWYVIITMEQ